jgi:SPP1 gp7 family putative phage head morphogenesis protein
MSSALDDHIRKHRERIAAGEEAARREIIAEYEKVRRKLQSEVRRLAAEIDAARASGKKISPAWLYRERRLKSLIDQINAELRRFGRIASAAIERAQREAVNLAVTETNRVIAIIGNDLPTVGAALPSRAIENVIGSLSDGSPLLNYFEEELAPTVSAKLRDTLIDGVARGKNANDIAREILKTGDITRQRAILIARTETGRAYREASRSIYQENADLIEGWQWVASKSSRTCPACLYLDGTIYKLKESFPHHFNCRCTIIPVIKGISPPRRTIGRDWFERQPDRVKQEILGKAAAEAYSRGEVSLKDFVGWATSKQFGKRVYTRSLSTIINRQ